MISATNARLSTMTARYENAITGIVELINKAVANGECQAQLINHHCDLTTAEMSPIKQSLEQKGFEVSDEKLHHTIIKWGDPVDITNFEQDTDKQPFDRLQDLSACRAYRSALLALIKKIEQGIIDQVKQGQFEYSYAVSEDSEPLLEDIIDTVESHSFTVSKHEAYGNQLIIVIKWDK